MDQTIENEVVEQNQLEENEIIEQSASSKTLLTGIAIFASIIILGLIFMPKPDKHYKLNEEQMLEKIIKADGIAGPEVIVDLIYQPDNRFQFIDLRNATEYLKGHLPGAINIPINHVLDKEYEKIWEQEGKTNLLYYSDHTGACGPWMILNQLGYTNIKIVLGGYDYVNENIIKNYSPMTGNFRDERANFDFAKVINQTSGGFVGSAQTKETGTAGTPVLKKKKESKSSGGC